MKSFLRTVLYVSSLAVFTSSTSFGQIYPQEEPPDTTAVVPDSSKVSDDEFPLLQRPFKDTLVVTTYYSVNDSLREYFLADRLNLRDESNLLSPHDAADFARFNPSNLIIDYGSVPFRKTVAPFTLPGNRTNVILNNRSLSPVAHTLEPDNLVDFNDIPTSAVEDIYSIKGPLGMLFGGRNSGASIILFPLRPETARAESRMTVDKGWFGYSYTKAFFARQNRNGRSIRLAAGYRNSDGVFFNSHDNAYHQWGEIIYPLATKVRLNLSGRLYRRSGSYAFRPGLSSFYLDRFRRDRDLSAGLEIAHASDKASSIEFRHQRSESNLDRPGELYFRTLDIFDNSLVLSHERKLGPVGTEAAALFSFEKYTDAGITEKRQRGLAELKFLIGDSSHALSTYFKVEKVGEFDPAPSAALIFSKNGKILYLSGSVGYSTKFPRHYELNLIPRSASIIEASTPDYSESGNPDLDVERQLIGNLSFCLGKTGSDLMLSVTGGKMFDAIDWHRSDTAGLTFGNYSTANEDIEFADLAVRQRLSWRDMFYWSGGGSYRYVRMGDNDSLPYTPDYQAFSNAGIHYYIGRLDLHLYGYGEVVYHAAYEGYDGGSLGEEAIVNVKLSFRIKRFQFYYISQNALNVYYRAREDYTIPGRFNYYGVNWEFLD